MTPRHLLEPGRLAGAALLKAQSDSRLVDLTRAGNDRAFEAVVNRYKGPLLRYCSRILPDGRGEDAVQQTFLKAYNAIHADTTPLSLRGWLFGIAHNVSLNLLRQRGGDHEPLDSHDESATEATHRTVERRERFREVLAAVAALPPGQRDALLLRELEGRGHEEIARELGVSGGAARQLISRARNGIRAAAAAVMPMPLVMRLTDGAAAPPTAERMAELTALGTGVTVSKVVATAAIGTTLIGGAAVTGPDLGQGERDRRGADVAEAAEEEARDGETQDGDDDSSASGSGERGGGDHRSGHRGGDDDDDRDRGDEAGAGDDRSGHRDGDDDRDDRSGPGDREQDDEREDDDDDDNSGPGSDDDEPDEPDDDNSGPRSANDEPDEPETDDSSGPDSGDDSDDSDLVEPDDDVIEADRVEVDNSGPSGVND